MWSLLNKQWSLFSERKRRLITSSPHFFFGKSFVERELKRVRC